MGLLASAREACRGPEHADLPAIDRDGIRRLVRDLDLWCSSCMVAFEGSEPVAVLLGAKRHHATLVHDLRVSPAHRRRGHARHLLTSLGQKLAILGPDRLVAEVPSRRAAAVMLLASCGWEVEAVLLDWRRPTCRRTESPRAQSPNPSLSPLGLDDLLASGVLGDSPARAWRREPAALRKLKDELDGLALYSPDRLEAWALMLPAEERLELLAIGHGPSELGRAGLSMLIEELASRADGRPLEIPRLAPDELSPELLAELGFESTDSHLLYATRARAA